MSDVTSPHICEATTSDLVQRAQHGDALAWDELVERFGSLVWWTARQRGLSNADAADVSQTTWLRCVQSIDKIRDPEAIRSWLVTTARREAIRLSKRAGRHVLVGDEQEHQLDMIDVRDQVSVDTSLIAEEEDRGVRQAMERLPKRGQDLLIALMAEDRPNYTAIAAEFDMPIGSIGPTRARHLERLRQTPEIRAITLDP